MSKLIRGTKRKPAARDERNFLLESGSLSDPNLEQLKEEFMFCLNERDSSVFTRARINHDSRYCIWPGQSEDGRKWTNKIGTDAFPWNGSSDARVNLIDKYIRKHVAFGMTLWTKMRLRVAATEINDEKWANQMTNYLRWQLYTQMTEARSETELLLNYILESGQAVKGTFWAKQKQLGYEDLDLETLVEKCFQQAQGESADQRFLDLPEMRLNPAMDAESVPLLTVLFPDTPAGQLTSALSDLRETGSTRFVRPVVTVNRPKIIAYRPNEDIFISPDAKLATLDDANVFAVEVMRETRFRGYAQAYDWDPEWTETIIDTQRGNVEFAGLLFNQRLNRQASYLIPARGQLDIRKLYLVVHGYRRLTDKNGVPGIFYTVFHPHFTETCGKHELLNYDHGKMPFTLYQTERRSRRADDARGYGEVGSTWQMQIKSEWDNRIDRASIGTLPPSHYPPGQQPDKWGPGVQVPTNNPDGYGFFEPAGDPMGSKEVEESVQKYSDDYFGFVTDPENAGDAAMLKQKFAEDFMAGEMSSGTQLLQLCQQFEDDDIYFRVVGSSKGQVIHTTRDQIQGEFDLQIAYESADMDPQMKLAKLGLLEQALQLDVTGQIDRSEALVVAFEIMDPNLGERLLKPADSASMAEVEDEQTVMLKLLQGQPVPVKPGQAYQLRMQTLQNFLQQSGSAQKQLMSNPQAQDAVRQRIKDLQFQYQQQVQNPVIGRGGPAFAPKVGKT